jgi:dTDP-4-dehydrorhamnose 3,5-epimerase
VTGTLRGLHFQAAPHGEVKLVRCTRGRVYDVMVDIRKDSPSFGQWWAGELSAETRRAHYVPVGFAHGFQTLEPDAELFYQVSQPYCAESDRGLRWNDPQLAIAWPGAARRVISEKDRKLPFLSDF